jgi:hypothetical protein
VVVESSRGRTVGSSGALLHLKFLSQAITEEVHGTITDSDHIITADLRTITNLDRIRAIAGTLLADSIMDFKDSKVHQAALLSVISDF